MFRIFMVAFLIMCYSSVFAQYEFDSSDTYPFGRANPAAPEALLDYAPLIGESTCVSESRNADQTWSEPIEMTWRWKYIMHGFAVQDETLKSDGKHSGSIRQYIVDSTSWFVHYYSSNAPTIRLSTWEGNKTDAGKIVLYRDQKAPNGTEGYFRLTFYDMTSEAFKWVGEWVDKSESINFPTWKISCKKNL